MTKQFIPGKAIRLANVFGRLVQTTGLELARFEEDIVCQKAIQATGLDDFGDPHFRAGLNQLLESAEKDARFNLIGRLGMQRLVTHHLSNRLLLVESRKQSPEIFRRPLIPPIIVMGLARSGTTYLHRLLAVDPRHRAIPFWEVMRPIPHKTPDRRRAAAIRELKIKERLYPNLDNKHFSTVDTPEECVSLLGPTFVSRIFWTFGPVHGYLAWFDAQDRLKAYQEYYWILQILQAVDPTRRLVLKYPSHMGAVSAILQVMPQAMLVQLNRDPLEAAVSFLSLLSTLHQGVVNELDIPRLAETNIRSWVHEIELNFQARQQHPGKILDVDYNSLKANPLKTVRQIYDHFGLEFTPAYERRLQAHIQANPQTKYGAHSYAPEDFGLTEKQLAQRFEAYRESFGFASTH